MQNHAGKMLSITCPHIQKLGSVLLVLLCIIFHINTVSASCHLSSMCCPGRNNSCFAVGPREGEQPTSKRTRCFCDQACSQMSDCCADYRLACKPRDCEVHHYSQWTKCSNPCGVGVQLRRRKVRVYPENGGKLCPTLKQRRGCIGAKYGECVEKNLLHISFEAREIARILPAKFGKFRLQAKYDPVRDPLRKNLFPDTGHHVDDIIVRPTYCARFEVVFTHKKCNDTDAWADSLIPGATVCVECQPLAMFKHLGQRCKGHGVYNQITEWNAIGVHGCRGTWKMITERSDCVCTSDETTDFILL